MKNNVLLKKIQKHCEYLLRIKLNKNVGFFFNIGIILIVNHL